MKGRVALEGERERVGGKGTIAEIAELNIRGAQKESPSFGGKNH